MKMINIVTLTQIFSWGIFITGDYISENYSNDLLLMAALLFLPLILPVVYLIFQKKVSYETLPKWVNTLTVLLVWSAENIIFAWLANLLNIVPQSHEGWKDLLNGIEYSLFPLLNITAALIIVILWNIVLFVYRKLKG